MPDTWGPTERRKVIVTIHTKDGKSFTDRESAELTREEARAELDKLGKHAAFRGYYLLSGLHGEVMVPAENLSHISYVTREPTS
jgi:hypothetical protein